MELCSDIAKFITNRMGCNPKHSLAYREITSRGTLFFFQGDFGTEEGFQIDASIEGFISPFLIVEVIYYKNYISSTYCIYFERVFQCTEVISIIALLISKVRHGETHKKWMAIHRNSEFVLRKK